MITHLREEAINRMRNTYPSTLEGWDTLRRDADKPILNGIAVETLNELWRLAQVSHQSYPHSTLPAVCLQIAGYRNDIILHVANRHATNLPRTFLESILTGKESLTCAYRTMVFAWLGRRRAPPGRLQKP
jgi:hypothetical protein